IPVERADLIKGVVRIETFDSAHFGRKTGETFVDAFDGTLSFTNALSAEYEEDFQFGLIPTRAQTIGGAGGTVTAETTTLSFDPLRRRWTATVMDYTGAVRTNTWDYRWSSPAEIETPHRRTVGAYNRDETAVQGEVTAAGEILQSFAGQYDA